MGKGNRGSNMTVMVIILAVITIATAGASDRVSSTINEYSIVDCLQSRGKPSSKGARRKLAEQEVHPEWRERMTPYLKTAEQNRHMIADHCQQAKAYGYNSRKKRSRESFATYKSPKISLGLYHEIRLAARDTARNHGLDEEKFLQTIGCESIGFDPNARNDNGSNGVDRGIAQINTKYHPKVTYAQAYNWRWSLGYAARLMKQEYVRKDGTVYSYAAQWYCYKKKQYLGYGIASIRVNSNRTAMNKVALAWGSD